MGKKSKTRNKTENDEYTKIQDELANYDIHYDLHLVMTSMIHEAWKQNEEDPVKYFIDYLLQQKGSNLKEYATEKILQDNLKKDEVIKELKDKIKNLEKCSKEESLELQNTNLLGIGTQAITNFLEHGSLSEISISGIEFPSTQSDTQQFKNPENKHNMTAQSVGSFWSLDSNDLVIDQSLDSISGVDTTDFFNISFESISSEAVDDCKGLVAAMHDVATAVENATSFDKSNVDDFNPDYELED